MKKIIWGINDEANRKIWKNFQSIFPWWWSNLYMRKQMIFNLHHESITFFVVYLFSLKHAWTCCSTSVVIVFHPWIIVLRHSVICVFLLPRFSWVFPLFFDIVMSSSKLSWGAYYFPSMHMTLPCQISSLDVFQNCFLYFHSFIYLHICHSL